MINSPKNFGDWAVVAIRRHSRKILKHEAKVLLDQDPEELHQMRVGMRRLRSGIAGFELAIRLPKTVKSQKVGAIARILGQLRDLDVQRETLTTVYQPLLSPQEQIHLTELLERLENRRGKVFKFVQNTLKTERYRHLKKGLEEWLNTPKLTAIAAYPITEILPDILLPQFSQFLLHPGWLVATEWSESSGLISVDLENNQIEKLLTTENSCLHDLRKVAKRTRYLMELFTDFYGDDYQETLKKIKLLQEILGEIQDSVVLSTFLQTEYSG
ncbi:MAG: CHAD domain-containing protein, partial [Microcystaceae cyanobacterium]